MSKKNLVTYFSCSGVTEKTAKALAKAADADIFEIKPEEAYSAADLDWRDKQSRCTLEMTDPKSRPAIAGKVDNLKEYKNIFVGFPIWWGIAPHIINTFLESDDFSGKTVIPFATSGGSGMGGTVEALKPSCKEGVNLLEGKLLNEMDVKELKAWVESLAL